MRLQRFILSCLHEAQFSFQTPLLPPYFVKLPTKSIPRPLIGLGWCPLCTNIPNSSLAFPLLDTRSLAYGLDIDDGPLGICPFLDVTAALRTGGRRLVFELPGLGPPGIPCGDTNCCCGWMRTRSISGGAWNVRSLGVDG